MTVKINFLKENIERFKNGEIISVLAQDTGCSYSTMRRFLKSNVENYKKIAKEHEIERSRKVTEKNIIHFSTEKEVEYAERFENGETLGELAQEVGCSWGTIRGIMIEVFGVEKGKKIGKKHRQETCRKTSQLPRTKKQKEAARKTLAKWKKEHPEEHAEHGRKWQKAGVEASVKANASKQEILFSVLLANENIQFIHQFRIFYKDNTNAKKRYWWVDFFIFPNIIVQLDGIYWHCKRGGLLSDWLQNQELKKQRFKVIRFWDFEINNNIEKCIKKLKNLTYLFC